MDFVSPIFYPGEQPGVDFSVFLIGYTKELFKTYYFLKESAEVRTRNVGNSNEQLSLDTFY